MAWPAQVNYNTTVHFKNAIEPTYFMHCSSRFVSGQYDVVLYDFGPNMWGGHGSAVGLARLVERMRKLTGSSVSALIDWPRRSNRHDSVNTARAAELSHSFSFGCRTVQTCTRSRYIQARRVTPRLQRGFRVSHESPT